jgi:type VI secretion system Hcp family effector
MAIYAKFKGSKSGDIPGSLKTPFETCPTRLKGFEYKMTTPVHAGTGQHVGKKVLEALVFYKEVDQGTPILARILDQNEAFEGEVKFTEVTTGKAQKEETYLTIKFEGGRVILHSLDTETEEGGPGEEFRVIPHKMTMIHAKTNTEHEISYLDENF